MLHFQTNFSLRVVNLLNFMIELANQSPQRLSSAIHGALPILNLFGGTPIAIDLSYYYSLNGSHSISVSQLALVTQLPPISAAFTALYTTIEQLGDGSLTLSASLLFSLFLDTQEVTPNKNLPEKLFKDSFRGVRRALRHLESPQQILEFYIDVARLNPRVIELLDMPTNVVIPFLSKFKTFLHNNADFVPDFRYYMDLANIAGYPAMIDRELSDDPTLWLSTPTESAYTQSWWANAFQCSFNESFKRPRAPQLSYKQFVLNRWLWSTDGATRFSSATLDGEVQRTKFGAALSISDEDLLRHAFLDDDSAFDIGIFLKPDEMGFKRRLIANVSLGPYILASYIRYLVERFVTDSPLFLKLKLTPADKLDVIDLINKRNVMLPLDESAYDYHVSRESWLGFISFLGSAFPDNDACALFSRYFENAHWSFDGKEGSWLSGMPSGLALTSFLNSWMNYIKQKVVVPGHLAFAAGDDVLTAPFRDQRLEDIESGYEVFGSAINAAKNWSANKYAEYLKTIYHQGGTTGYPARIFASLIWAGQERTFLPSDRLPELGELFKQFYDRLGQPLDEELVAGDLSRAVSHKVRGFGKTVAKQWLHAPKAYGGFGILPYNELQFRWEVSVLKRKKWDNVLIRVPEVALFDGKVDLKIIHRRLAIDKTIYFGPPLKLPIVTNLKEWEARLNGEDNPIKGNFGKMALDVVPLPTMNGISSANMSAFAKMYQVNVYPQLVGSSDTKLDRLVCASMWLADAVQQFLQDHHLVEFAN